MGQDRETANACACAITATWVGLATMAAAAPSIAAGQHTDFRLLFAQAIEAENRVVRAEVRGPLLAKIQSQIHTDARVFVEVKSEYKLKQEGCSRLKVTFSAPEAKLPTADGGTAPLDGIGFSLNICRDGNPPDVTGGG